MEKTQKEFYIKVNEDNIITGMFYREIKFENGKSTWNTQKENFDEEVDFENAIGINADLYGTLNIGDKYEDKEVEEEFENSQGE